MRYSFAGEPQALYICHCRECQKQSASAFGISLQVERSGFRLTGGDPRFWSRDTDSGRRVNCAYCPDCGSHIWHETGTTSETITIKAGSLDTPIDVSSAIHIWTTRKLPGIVIPEGAQQFPEEPPAI
ncbi:MAG: GFA family protein [Pseudomonadota bacterium]|nr:GFA family protein [Pseudomonadota bacterium]